MKKLVSFLLMAALMLTTAAALADGLTGNLVIASRYTGVQGEAFDSIIEGHRGKSGFDR